MTLLNRPADWPPRHERGPLSALPPTVAWSGGEDGCLVLLDQTVLPREIRVRRCETVQQVHTAIRELAVRGAPAIGVAGAYGLCLGTRAAAAGAADEFAAAVRSAAEYLIAARPTAVNLPWAVRRVARIADTGRGSSPREVWRAMLAECSAISAEEVEACRRIGEIGADLVPAEGGVLTHCNAGALATVAYGTALAPLYVAHERRKKFRVFADETRPLLQGSRLTAFELSAAGIDVSIVCDGAAASLMKAGRIQMAIVGADRIAANGDVANKIGTYSAALAARHHGIPFYVAAPLSTFDVSLGSGDAIPIEQRSADEVRGGYLREGAAAQVRCENPAFDVTPASLITGIVTPRGLLEPVSAEKVRDFLDIGG